MHAMAERVDVRVCKRAGCERAAVQHRQLACGRKDRGDDHQSEQTLAIESVSEELIKRIVASIADEESFDAGRVPLVPVAPTNGSR